MIKAIIFDMDGVIIDSEPLHFKAAYKTLKRYGKEFTEDLHREIIGTNEDYAWQYIVRKLSLSINYRKLMTEKSEMYSRMLVRECLPLPGVLEFIQSMPLPKAIASSSPRSNIDAVLARLNLTASFPIIVSGNDILHSKPDPEIYLKTEQKLRYPAQHCLVIEDSINGVKAAKAAGMKCIAITTSFPKEKLGHADYIIDNFSEIKEGWLA